jgi:RNA polymerase sigma-70 factor (ECF subfamily)
MVNREDAISAALEGLLERYGERVRQAGRQYGLQGADVDEVVQDVRIRLWHALATRERIAGVTASYVYRTATTAALDLLRRRRARREVSIEAEAAATDVRLTVTAAKTAEQGELAERIAAAVDAVVATRRPVVRMWLAGFELREIMHAFGYSEPKARNLLYRGLADVRARLLEMGIGPEAVS